MYFQRSRNGLQDISNSPLPTPTKIQDSSLSTPTGQSDLQVGTSLPITTVLFMCNDTSGDSQCGSAGTSGHTQC